MARIRIRRPANLSQEMVQLYDAIDSALETVLPRSLREEVELTGDDDAGITFTAATSKQVAHKLGRVPRYWRVTRDFGANAHALRETARDDKFLTLVSAATCTVYLGVS